jgi:hypothetical protein
VPTVELIMSEFGSMRSNAGGNNLSDYERLEPTLSSFLKIFPEASVKLYSDSVLLVHERVEVITVDPPFEPRAKRYGWRAHDYYQARGLLKSNADIAVAMDADMLIVSDEFRLILSFAERFGLALPLNPRLLARIDGEVGQDSTYLREFDETKGLGVAFNLTPVAFSTHHSVARALLERYCELLKLAPGRGAVHMSKACFEHRFQPCVLPPQWCVCSAQDFDSKHLWSNAIALHVGHKDVLPRWRMEARKRRYIEFFNRYFFGK